ncbi:MAG: hypothetical protein LBG65_05155 [Puniceicoccales bacterium]|nr:hypothetical protein [Puniceicoccales bacterium]
MSYVRKLTKKEERELLREAFSRPLPRCEEARKEEPVRQFNWKAAVIAGVCTWFGLKFLD